MTKKPTKTKFEIFPNAWSIVDSYDELVGEIQTDGKGGFNVLDQEDNTSPILINCSTFEEAQKYAYDRWWSE